MCFIFYFKLHIIKEKWSKEALFAHGFCKNNKEISIGNIVTLHEAAQAQCLGNSATTAGSPVSPWTSLPSGIMKGGGGKGNRSGKPRKLKIERAHRKNKWRENMV